MKRLILTLMAVVAILLAGAAPTLATKPDPEHKVAICHRTASDTNPYVLIEVDEASLDAHLNNLPGHPPKENADGSPRNDYLYTEATPCERSDSSPEPSTSPSPTGSPEPSSSPDPSPTSIPSPSLPPATPTPSASPTPVSPTLPPTDTSPSSSSGTAGFGLSMALTAFLFLTTVLVLARPTRR